jgi:cytochrome c-type biogenesis protein CcmH/NrfF
MRRPRFAAIAATAALIASLLPAAAALGAETSLPDIEDEVMCPICGTTLELSDSPQAERERQLIRRLVDRGDSKEEIKDALVAEYGDEVLAVPDRDGFDLTAWIVPALAALIAVAALAVGATRLRREADEPTAPAALDAADRGRLERDMSSHEP